MKKLTTLILLLIAMAGYSQQGLSDVSYKQYSEQFKEYNERFRGDTIVCEPTFEQELLFVLKKYKTDCYNDSTLVKSNDFIMVDSTWTDNGITRGWIRREYMNVWVHKQPTFIGFIEWLKNKQDD